MSSKGWIKLYRSLKEWEWYEDPNALRLLIHLLISVNYEEKKWKGITIKPGELITSYDKLGNELGLTKQQVRLSLKKLEQSKEITRGRTRHFLHISLAKWEKLQSEEIEKNPRTTHKRTREEPEKNPTITPTKESKEIKEIKKSVNIRAKIPSIEEFCEYCENALANFPGKYQSLEFALLNKLETWIDDGWKDGRGTPIKNWKTKIKNTIPYLKPMYNGTASNRTEQNKSDAKAQYERLRAKLHSQMRE